MNETSLYIELDDQGDKSEASSFVRKISELADRELSVTFLKSPDFDCFELPNYWVLKVSGFDALSHVNEIVEHYHSTAIECRVLPLTEFTELDSRNIKIGFYRQNRPNSNMVAYTDCNVHLLHKPTGKVAMCESFRSRAKNEAEAMLFLASLLAKENA